MLKPFLLLLQTGDQCDSEMFVSLAPYCDHWQCAPPHPLSWLRPCITVAPDLRDKTPDVLITQHLTSLDTNIYKNIIISV